MNPNEGLSFLNDSFDFEDILESSSYIIETEMYKEEKINFLKQKSIKELTYLFKNDFELINHCLEIVFENYLSAYENFDLLKKCISAVPSDLPAISPIEKLAYTYLKFDENKELRDVLVIKRNERALAEFQAKSFFADAERVHFASQQIVSNEQKRNIFHYACELGEEWVTYYTVTEKNKFQEVDEEGYSPFFLAVKQGHYSLVSKLIDVVNWKLANYPYPFDFFRACLKKDINVVRCFLELIRHQYFVDCPLSRTLVEISPGHSLIHVLLKLDKASIAGLILNNFPHLVPLDEGRDLFLKEFFEKMTIQDIFEWKNFDGFLPNFTLIQIAMKLDLEILFQAIIHQTQRKMILETEFNRVNTTIWIDFYEQNFLNLETREKDNSKKFIIKILENLIELGPFIDLAYLILALPDLKNFYVAYITDKFSKSQDFVEVILLQRDLKHIIFESIDSEMSHQFLVGLFTYVLKNNKFSQDEKEICKQLISRDSNFYTLFMLCLNAEVENFEIKKNLIQIVLQNLRLNELNNIFDEQGRSLLHIALLRAIELGGYEYREIIDILINHGAFIHQVDKSGINCFELIFDLLLEMFKLKKIHFSLLEIVLKAKDLEAKPNLIKCIKSLKIFTSSFINSNIKKCENEILKIILSNTEDFITYKEASFNLEELNQSIKSKNINNIITQNENINIENKILYTNLVNSFKLIPSPWDAIFKLSEELLIANFKPEWLVFDHEGNSLLHIACEKGYTEFASYLINIQKVNHLNRNSKLYTCLETLTYSAHHKKLNLLLSTLKQVPIKICCDTIYVRLIVEAINFTEKKDVFFHIFNLLYDYNPPSIRIFDFAIQSIDNHKILKPLIEKMAMDYKYISYKGLKKLIEKLKTKEYLNIQKEMNNINLILTYLPPKPPPESIDFINFPILLPIAIFYNKTTSYERNAYSTVENDLNKFIANQWLKKFHFQTMNFFLVMTFPPSPYMDKDIYLKAEPKIPGIASFLRLNNYRDYFPIRLKKICLLYIKNLINFFDKRFNLTLSDNFFLDLTIFFNLPYQKKHSITLSENQSNWFEELELTINNLYKGLIFKEKFHQKNNYYQLSLAKNVFSINEKDPKFYLFNLDFLDKVIFFYGIPKKGLISIDATSPYLEREILNNFSGFLEIKECPMWEVENHFTQFTKNVPALDLQEVTFKDCIHITDKFSNQHYHFFRLINYELSKIDNLKFWIERINFTNQEISYLCFSTFSYPLLKKETNFWEFLYQIKRSNKVIKQIDNCALKLNSDHSISNQLVIQSLDEARQKAQILLKTYKDVESDKQKNIIDLVEEDLNPLPVTALDNAINSSLFFSTMEQASHIYDKLVVINLVESVYEKLSMYSKSSLLSQLESYDEFLNLIKYLLIEIYGNQEAITSLLNLKIHQSTCLHTANRKMEALSEHLTYLTSKNKLALEHYNTFKQASALIPKNDPIAFYIEKEIESYENELLEYFETVKLLEDHRNCFNKLTIDNTKEYKEMLDFHFFQLNNQYKWLINEEEYYQNIYDDLIEINNLSGIKNNFIIDKPITNRKLTYISLEALISYLKHIGLLQ